MKITIHALSRVMRNSTTRYVVIPKHKKTAGQSKQFSSYGMTPSVLSPPPKTTTAVRFMIMRASLYLMHAFQCLQHGVRKNASRTTLGDPCEDGSRKGTYKGTKLTASTQPKNQQNKDSPTVVIATYPGMRNWNSDQSSSTEF